MSLTLLPALDLQRLLHLLLLLSLLIQILSSTGLKSRVSSDFVLVDENANYHAANGNRVEMVTTSNIDQHFGNMARNWMQRIGGGRPPQRILYIRDGEKCR